MTPFSKSRGGFTKNNFYYLIVLYFIRYKFFETNRYFYKKTLTKNIISTLKPKKISYEILKMKTSFYFIRDRFFEKLTYFSNKLSKKLLITPSNPINIPTRPFKHKYPSTLLGTRFLKNQPVL